ncbi:MAG: hypothetical protein Q9195_000605 [Heterodermia aff. obscurata]
MSSSLRYMAHDISGNDPDLEGIRSTEDPRGQLIKSLKKLVKGYPPKNSYDIEECHGLYSGPTSIAFLFLHISRSHPDLKIKGLSPRDWAAAYLSGKRTFSAVTSANCGIINEFLAFHAVHATTYLDDVMDLQKFLAALESTVKTTERMLFPYPRLLSFPRTELNLREGKHITDRMLPTDDSNEWLYGRAGSLYLLRLIRAWSPSSGRFMDRLNIISEAMQPILDHAPSWPWHGKDYLGAVHGRIGIITQVILSDPLKAAHPAIMQSLKETLDLQDEQGNWPSSKHSPHNDLVQFCHGAPGFIIALKAIEPHLSFDLSLQSRVASAYTKAQQCVVKKGLLTKQPNLCHGISGNALALPTPWREFFLDHTTAEAMEKGLREGSYVPGDDAYGLFCGESGRAWAWLALMSEQERGMIGFNDI